MFRLPIEQFLSALQVDLRAFAVCEISKDWRLNVGPLPTMVFHFVLKGRGYVEAGGLRKAITPGTIILVPPNTAKSIAGDHEVTHEASAEHSCVLHSESLLAFRALEGTPDLVLGCASLAHDHATPAGVFAHFDNVITIDIAGDQTADLVLKSLFQELAEPKIGSLAMVECLMKQLLLLLLRTRLDEVLAASPGLGGPADPRLLKAFDAAVSHPEDAHTVSSLANLAGMSRSSFAAKFAQHFQQTPMQFVHSIRMRSAARLLVASDVPIKCLASAVGYSSRSQFSRAFRDTFGTDPTKYRATRTK